MNCQRLTRLTIGSWSISAILVLVGLLVHAEPTQQELEDASRLAARATFGMTYEQIVDMAEQGLNEWLDEQLEMDCTYFVPVEDQLFEMHKEGEYDDLRDLIDAEVEIDEDGNENYWMW
ncbi:MAG: hypothetical protein OXG24_07990, partial [Gammaproteobacteria bacterium]|nr:hypothetical protein [Gammaproteobacteria bacterium]